MNARLSRRHFLQASTVAAAGYWVGAGQALAQERSPNERLNLGIVGVANRASANLSGVSSQNIVALCDIDDRYLAAAADRHPQAVKYNDFRRMMERNDLDAVVVSTPDHTHAPAAAMALRSGRHVYCEKPLTHNIYEARTLAQLARENRRVTQMGTQIHAENNYRRVVELIQSGAIGPVSDVHVWVGKTWSGGERPTETPMVPSHLHWDLWLGPAPVRPYHSTYLPGNWRRWWEFGGGTLADMGCHYMDLPYWALNLRYPTAVEPVAGTPIHPETTPRGQVVRWEFPARENAPPVRMTWYDTDQRPALFNEPGQLPQWGDGVLFVGERGMLISSYSNYRLLPADRFEGFRAPEPTIPNSIGHHREWIEACKSNGPTTCNFDYSGALTETVLLGNIAYRLGRRVEWDGPNLRVTNLPEAERLIRREYRQGWTL